MAGTWELELRDDGCGALWVDVPGEKVNLLGAAVMRELEEHLDRAAVDARLAALVFASRKPGVFFAGADVKEIQAVRDEQAAYAAVRQGQLILDKIARLPFPTVAAVDGPCLGGGLELALACAHRVVSDNPKTQLGLPEVKVGIIPGFGGTQRLPRLVGLQQALRMILNGSSVDGRRAAKTGLADACVPAAAVVDEAVALALRAARQRAPRAAYRPRSLKDRFLEGTAFGRGLIFKKSLDAVMAATRGHYPAPLAALDAVREGHGLPFEKALEVEARHEVPLVVSEVSKNLIRIFFLAEAVKKQTGVEPPAAARPVARVGVLGAGVMGGGIAQLAAQRGFAVRMKDVKEEFLSKGLAEAHRLFDRRVKRGRARRHEVEAAMARISPTLGYDGFSTLDVVVEAVVERLEVKRQVLREAEEASKGRALFASNTSSLPITEIAREARRPEWVVGMHFFNPVEKMPLVEVIRGSATCDEAVATVFDLAKRLGKVPVVCRDGPGFLVNRLLMPYLNESAYLLQEGVAVEALDAALLEFGMPMGPARLLDEVGLDVAFHVGGFLESRFPERMPGCPLIRQLAEEGLLGKKGGAGFYLYRNGRAGKVNPAARRHLPAGRAEVRDDLLVDRMILPMVNEATRVLDEGIVRTPREVDLGMIMGAGFPPFRGGLLRYADALGAKAVADRLRALAGSVGQRYAPSPRLLAMAERREAFYGPGE